MSTENETVLSIDDEQKLLAPIDEYIAGIQAKIDELRADGTDRITSLNNHIAIVKENANYTRAEKASLISEDKAALVKAKEVEAQNKNEISSLISQAEKYLDEHYDKEYYSKVAASSAGISVFAVTITAFAIAACVVGGICFVPGFRKNGNRGFNAPRHDP